MRRLFVILAVVFAVAIPLFASEIVAEDQSGNAAARPCSLAGVWYGGSDPHYPYLFKFAPAGGNRYTTLTELGADARPFGFTWWTGWMGEATLIEPGSWDSWGISFWSWDPDAATAAGVDGSLPSLEIVHSRIDLVDCDTFTSAIDVYAIYFGYTGDKVPFVDPYDLSYLLPGETLVETYRRMPQWQDSPAKDVPVRLDPGTVPKFAPVIARKR